MRRTGYRKKLAVINIATQDEREKRTILKEEKEDLLKSELNDKKDAIFNARGDSKEIVESEADAVEKLFKLNAIIASLIGANITSKDFDEQRDKQYAKDTNEIVYSCLDEIDQSLTDEQREDVKTITEILAVDEDTQIKTLSSQLQAAKKNVKSLEKRIETATQAKNDGTKGSLEAIKEIKTG